MASFTLKVNGQNRVVDVNSDTPVLYVLRDNLALRGPRFGCGLAQCGFGAAPKVDLALIDRPGTPAWGAGEPTACAVPAAIANAVFDATGVRLRSLPFTPDKVKAALAQGPTRA